MVGSRVRRSGPRTRRGPDRKSTRLNSSHGYISYAVFCLKKKNTKHEIAALPILFSPLRRIAGLALVTPPLLSLLRIVQLLQPPLLAPPLDCSGLLSATT